MTKYGRRRPGPAHPDATSVTRATPATLALLAVLATLPSAAIAQEDSGTAGVFRRWSDHVVRIEVREGGSGAKAGVGSGFFVSPDGHLVTNYHVIADVVHHPDRYTAHRVEAGGMASPLEVLAVDVVHDLAVLRLDEPTPRFFALAEPSIRQGERLYSLGHPNDLGLSIVEGTFNGLLRHTLYPKIHFTGSINPGMSGGPTLTRDGRVVGINVSTSGEQVSFLVPVNRAARLLAGVDVERSAPADGFLGDVAEQVRDYQAEYLDGMFGEDGPAVDLGPYRVVTAPAPFFRCWGDASGRRDDQAYETAYHECSTDDYLYIADGQQSGVVTLSHQLVTNESLNARRFLSLYASTFGQDNTPYGDEEHVTSWRCATRNVRNATTPMRGVLCLRGYRKLDGLYDAVLKVAVLASGEAGLVSTLILSGVTWESIDALTARYLERVTWQ